jgi:YVTN family beta-propeller protein
VTAHPDGKRIFVSATGAGTVQAIDMTTNKIVAELEACDGPSDVGPTPSGSNLPPSPRLRILDDLARFALI